MLYFRCLASVVAVCVAIALMLQRRAPYFDSTSGLYNIEEIIKKSYDHASCLLSDANHVIMSLGKHAHSIKTVFFPLRKMIIFN